MKLIDYFNESDDPGIDFDRFVERTQQIADLFRDFHTGCNSIAADEYVLLHNKAFNLFSKNAGDLLDVVGVENFFKGNWCENGMESEDSNG